MISSVLDDFNGGELFSHTSPDGRTCFNLLLDSLMYVVICRRQVACMFAMKNEIMSSICSAEFSPSEMSVTSGGSFSSVRWSRPNGLDTASQTKSSITLTFNSYSTGR